MVRWWQRQRQQQRGRQKLTNSRPRSLAEYHALPPAWDRLPSIQPGRLPCAPPGLGCAISRLGLHPRLNLHLPCCNLCASARMLLHSPCPLTLSLLIVRRFVLSPALSLLPSLFPIAAQPACCLWYNVALHSGSNVEDGYCLQEGFICCWLGTWEMEGGSAHGVGHKGRNRGNSALAQHQKTCSLFKTDWLGAWSCGKLGDQVGAAQSRKRQVGAGRAAVGVTRCTGKRRKAMKTWTVVR